MKSRKGWVDAFKDWSNEEENLSQDQPDFQNRKGQQESHGRL
jgi:hypothetical protein